MSTTTTTTHIRKKLFFLHVTKVVGIMVLCGNNRSCNSKNTIHCQNNNNCTKITKFWGMGTIMEQRGAITITIRQWSFLNLLGSMKTCHVWQFQGRFEI
jgi:hypothetical protein